MEGEDINEGTEKEGPVRHEENQNRGVKELREESAFRRRAGPVLFLSVILGNVLIL